MRDDLSVITINQMQKLIAYQRPSAFPPTLKKCDYNQQDVFLNDYVTSFALGILRPLLLTVAHPV